MALTLIFTLGEEVYGLEIEAIQEILEDPPRHFVPRAAGVLDGAVNFHGQILASIDLPTLLGFAEQRRDPRRVVLTGAYKALVLTVSSIQRIVDLDLSACLPPPANGGRRAIRGIVTHGETPVNLLDTGEISRQLQDLYA